ncbi:hypothetical protein [Thermotoga sp. KOL6]|uniref:hypothetical protein n=1 Tax=Thermotoga sp. KOL6 TaxID=126741 RepID=UPI000C7663CB|nr:hypothetical protein [Thermotoga sp. KOL6]PLV60024.1 hypothetical protein AS005_01670 [Thermotoga sp. KOL6]
MKSLTLVFLVLMVISLFSWSGHEGLTYYIVKDIVPDELVKITPYNYQEKRVYNLSKLVLEDVCGKDTIKAWDGAIIPPNPAPVNGKVPAWQILTVYSSEPDWGMDQGLDLSPYQFLIGNSQGVRHMKYRILGLEFFEADKSFYYFHDLSKEAFRKGDRYWGYRFLARALHYIEDLSQPYHNTPGELGEIFRALFDHSITRMLMNAHYVYDDYLAYLIYSGDEETIKTIENAKPVFLKSEWHLVQEIRKLALSYFPKVHREIKKVFGEKLKERKGKLESFTVISVEEFKEADERGDLSNLKRYTLELIGKTASYLKGYLIDFLKAVRTF